MSPDTKSSIILPSVASLAVPIAVETLLRNLINTMNVFLLSGAETGFDIRNVRASRMLNADPSKRGKLGELLISNYAEGGLL